MPDIPALAARLHAGQTDSSGVPYIEHLLAVARILLRRWPDATPAEVAAAWLHDAVGDGRASFDGLLLCGVPAEAVAVVRELTRPEGLPCREWIAGLAARGSASAIRVKLADNEHDGDPARHLPGSDIVERRYAPARRVLEAALAERGAAR